MATAIFGSAKSPASGQFRGGATSNGLIGIRRRPNATARHVKAADYVGQLVAATVSCNASCRPSAAQERPCFTTYCLVLTSRLAIDLKLAT
jgi:hypothetical protein